MMADRARKTKIIESMARNEGGLEGSPLVKGDF
jgi:hypothetical protein